MDDNNNNDIQPGRVVRVHSLKSAAGQELNGKRAAVLRWVSSDERYEVVMETVQGTSPISEGSKAIRPANLTPEQRLPLPNRFSGDRGIVTTFDTEMFPTLCQLLLWYRPDDGYRPPDTMLMGMASMAFMRMGQENFMYFVNTQMEQMAGVLALANLLQQGWEVGWDAGQLAASNVVFALLEGDTMYVEVLAQTLYWTGYIGPEEENTKEDDFRNCPPTKLSPDQDQPAYIRTMAEGPLKLLQDVCRYNNLGRALFAALASCQFYHLLVQRLLRLVAREALGTADGKTLGPKARKILRDGIRLPAANDDAGSTSFLKRSVSTEVAQNILDRSASVLVNPDQTTRTQIMGLLQED